MMRYILKFDVRTKILKNSLQLLMATAIAMTISGCTPDNVVDVFTFTNISSAQSAADAVESQLKDLQDINIYPYKASDGCRIKRADFERLSVCLRGSTLIVSGFLRKVALEKEREAFTKFVAKLKDELKTKNVTYQVDSQQDLPKEKILQLNVYN